MLTWITTKLRAFTQKSTPSSGAAVQTSPEPSASSFVETLKELLRTLDHVRVAKELCETPESALAIIRDADNRRRDLRNKIHDLLTSENVEVYLKTAPLSSMMNAANNRYCASYSLNLGDRLVMDVNLTHPKHYTFDGEIKKQVRIQVGNVGATVNPKLYDPLMAAIQCLRS